MFEAEIPNDDQRLRTGRFAEAEIVIDPAAQAIVLPEPAIVEFAGNQKVWRVIDGVASEQSITTSERRTGFRRVAEGLAIGDRVLIDGDVGLVANVIDPSASPEAASRSDQEIESQGSDLPTQKTEQTIKLENPTEVPESRAANVSSERESL